MKRIAKGGCPPLLQTHIETYPKGSYESMRNAHPEVYKQISAQLACDQGGLCGYCEIDLVFAKPKALDDFRVEHFHEKSDVSTEINYGLQWHNLIAVCHGGSVQALLPEHRNRYTEEHSERTCDVPKGNRPLHAVILNPLDIPAEAQLFGYIEQGEMAGGIVVNEKCPAELKERANNTVKELRLDSVRLNPFRKAVLDGLAAALSRILCAQRLKLMLFEQQTVLERRT